MIKTLSKYWVCVAPNGTVLAETIAKTKKQSEHFLTYWQYMHGYLSVKVNIIFNEVKKKLDYDN